MFCMSAGGMCFSASTLARNCISSADAFVDLLLPLSSPEAASSETEQVVHVSGDLAAHIVCLCLQVLECRKLTGPD